MGHVLRVNTTVIRGGPISAFWLLLFLAFSVKKVCRHENTTSSNLFMESMSCGFGYSAFPHKVGRYTYVSLFKDE